MSQVRGFSPLRVAFHAVAAYMMYWGYEQLGTLAIDTFFRSQYGGHLQYLTIQG